MTSKFSTHNEKGQEEIDDRDRSREHCDDGTSREWVSRGSRTRGDRFLHDVSTFLMIAQPMTGIYIIYRFLIFFFSVNLR